MTAAIVSVSNTKQLPAVFRLASSVLSEAADRNNTTKVVLLAHLADATQSELAEVERIAVDGFWDGDVFLENIEVVLRAADLSFLRLVPASSAEVCAIPDELSEEDVARTIECLRRPPPIAGELPDAWEEHVRFLEQFDYFYELWKETKEKSAVSPRDMLSLCMFTKVVSIAMRTTSNIRLRSLVEGVHGAKAAGLMDIFGISGQNPPTPLEFIEDYALRFKTPWYLSELGATAAAAAREVLARVFARARAAARVVAASSLALVLRDVDAPETDEREGRVVVVDSGPRGDLGKLLLRRVPVRAKAVDGLLRVELTPVSSTAAWAEKLNLDMRATARALLDDAPATEASSALVGAYAALASSYIYVDVDTHDALASTSLSRVATGAILTFPPSLTAHINRQLTIRENYIQVHSTMASIAVQPGLSIACTFLTFCSTTQGILSAVPFTAPAAIDIVDAQAKVEAIATALDDPNRPLGLLRGMLGGVVEFDGADYRLCHWRIGGEIADSYVTLLPRGYVDVAFADYATGARSLDPDEFAAPVHSPFFAADSMFTLFRSATLPDSGGLAFVVPSSQRLALLRDDESQLYTSYASAVDAYYPGGAVDPPPELGGEALTFFVRESGNDRLTGLGVGWSRTASSGRRVVLVAENEASERVSF